MIKKIIPMILGLYTSICFAANDAQISIEGKYDCHGTEIPTNKPFGCEMVIQKTSNTYASSATCDDGNSYIGNGIYNKKENSLSTGFKNLIKAEEIGVSISYLKNNGQMVTDWTYLNATTIGHTVCIKK